MGVRAKVRTKVLKATAAAMVTAAGTLAAGCADMGAPRTVAAAPTRCRDERFPIYFARGSATLSPDSLAVIRAGSHRVTGCRISAVDVTGVATPDASTAAADPTLTQKRADAVALALAQAGLPPPSFDVQVAGAPPLPAAGVRVPLPRRTEVVLHASPA